MSKAILVHGVPSGKHPLYATHHNMKVRCTNPNYHSYHRYGGRGIKMHEPWRRDFKVFAEWVYQNLGPRVGRMELDRIDNDGDYAPGNVRWTSHRDNVRNSTTSGESPGFNISRYARGGYETRLQLGLRTFETHEEAETFRRKAAIEWNGTLNRILEWVTDQK